MNRIESLGFQMVRDLLTESDIGALRAAVSRPVAEAGSRARGGATYAVRNLLDADPLIRRIADGPLMRSLVTPILGEAAMPVRGILFDKRAEANWSLGWHQDTVIAVQSRVESPGYGPWSVKAGVVHVRPPAEVLEQMVAARIHLDPCDEENGALRVLPTTHSRGLLDKEDIPAITETIEPVTCHAKCGDVLLMRPLLLHSSGKAERADSRRVIHIEYAGINLPGQMQWHEDQART